METLRNKLLASLQGSQKLAIAEYIQQRYLELEPVEEVQDRLDGLVKTLQQIPVVSDPDHQVLVVKETADFDEEEAGWSLTVKKKGDQTEYAVDLIPFAELFTYPVENYQEDVGVIGDLIWDLTFDGWTIEEQAERIAEFDASENRS